MKNKVFFWLRISGILLFVGIALQIDWLSVWEILKNVHPGYVLCYFVAFMAAVLLKIIRLRYFLSCLGYTVAFRGVYQCVVEPAFYGMVTPARIGEFSKVLYLTRFGLVQSQSWSVVFLERVIDFLVLLIASIVGALYFFLWGSAHGGWCAVLFFMMVLSLYVGLFKITGLFGVLNRIDGRFFPGFLALKDVLVFIQDQGGVSAKTFLPLSLLILAVSFMQLWLLGLGLGIDANGFYLGLAYTSSSLVSLLPLSIGGLGTREAVYISLLGRQGVSADAAITLSLLDGLILSMLAQLILTIPLLKKIRHG